MGDEYKKMKMCKYCENIYLDLEVSHKMTLKMIIQTDLHLIVDSLLNL